MQLENIKPLFRILLLVGILLVTVMGPFITEAQSIKPSVFPAANSNLNSTSSSLIWTVGEGVVGTLENSSVRLYMGFIMPLSTSQTVSRGSVKAGPNLAGEVVPLQGKVLIYPNPVRQGGTLHIRGEQLIAESVKLKLISSNGQQMDVTRLSAVFDESTSDLELQVNLPAGFYLLQIPAIQGFISRKLIVR